MHLWHGVQEEPNLSRDLSTLTMATFKLPTCLPSGWQTPKTYASGSEHTCSLSTWIQDSRLPTPDPELGTPSSSSVRKLGISGVINIQSYCEVLHHFLKNSLTIF